MTTPADAQPVALPAFDPSKPRSEQGLYRKFKVTRTDGSDAPGGKHDGCYYFVIDRTHDKYAPAALLAYADACEAKYPMLAADLRNWFPPPAPALAADAPPVAPVPQERTPQYIIGNTLSFFGSTIRCGDPWDDLCETAAKDAQAALAALTPAAPAQRYATVVCGPNEGTVHGPLAAPAQDVGKLDRLVKLGRANFGDGLGKRLTDAVERLRTALADAERERDALKMEAERWSNMERKL